MNLSFAKVAYDPAVFAGTTLEVLHLEEKYGWTISAHQKKVSFQDDYWCSVEHLNLGRTGRGTTVLGRGSTLDEALTDLAKQLAGQTVTVYHVGEGNVPYQLPALVHTLTVVL